MGKAPGGRISEWSGVLVPGREDRKRKGSGYLFPVPGPAVTIGHLAGRLSVWQLQPQLPAD